MLGQGSQITIKSWYMPPHMFEKSILNLGRWSTLTELQFSLLDEGITDKNPSLSRGPLSRTQWEGHGRASLGIKKARVRLEAAAAKLFN
jgi:hypothetical protein